MLLFLQFTAMTAHLEIDYLLNTYSWKTSYCIMILLLESK